MYAGDAKEFSAWIILILQITLVPLGMNVQKLQKNDTHHCLQELMTAGYTNQQVRMLFGMGNSDAVFNEMEWQHIMRAYGHQL